MRKRSGASGRAGEHGQGLTEYLIILALIVIAAIGVYSFFGQTAVRQQQDEAANPAPGKPVAKESAGATSAAGKAAAKPVEPKGAADSKGGAAGK